jgi:uncharacterized protein
MGDKIKFRIDLLDFEAELNESPCAQEILKNLPITSEVSTWGDEIYFDTRIRITKGNPTMNVNVGDVAYWPTGRCLCVFFGPTPASRNANPAPASEVFIIGRTDCPPDELRAVRDGDPVTVERG